MNWTLALQYIAYGFLICVYGAFAWVGKAPVEGFIAILTGAITALGATHAASASAKNAAKAAADAIATVNPPAPAAAPTVVVKE
jgi:hypothetical protein